MPRLDFCCFGKGETKPMKSFLKRLAGTIPVLLGVVLLIFIMLRIIPGNAAVVLMG